MNANERERERERGKRREKNHWVGIGKCIYHRLIHRKNRDRYTHSAVANFNVWSLSKHIYKSIMIVFILTIHFLQIIFSTSQDLSNIRYNPLISAQCKARCLYEYRNHSQQHRSLFIDGKTKRLLVSWILVFSFKPKDMYIHLVN
jgi:hypothetical protein